VLHGPAIAVGVGEKYEPPPGEVLDVARIHATLDELGAGRLGIVTTNCRPSNEPGVASVIPAPIAIEHADPGGVS